MLPRGVSRPFPAEIGEIDMGEKVGIARNPMATRAVAAATIGTALEWFDFTLYGAVSATVLPKLFFRR
jgi:hypothetical protein